MIMDCDERVCQKETLLRELLRADHLRMIACIISSARLSVRVTGQAWRLRVDDCVSV